MSLQFIMGPSGAGKSHYLYDWVTKESLQNPTKRYLVLVPEQFTMQTQKDLVMTSPRKGIMNVEALSFHRLAQRVFEETGENQRVVLNDVGKNFVIRKIAGEQEENLTVLGSHLRKIGYISEIKSIISEFTQYDIQQEQLEEMLDKTKDVPSLYYKLQDIQVIYEKFREYLANQYITGEEVLDVLASVASRSRLLNGSVIVLDGFTGFTPVQNKLLRQLLQVCEDVIVTVTMDASENPFAYSNPYQLFGLGKKMVTTLVQIANESGVNVQKPIYLYEKQVYRFRENAPLAFLESNLFRYGKKAYEEEQDRVQIWCAGRPQEEADFVAQRIRKLVRSGNCRYRDIAILTNGMDAYASYIERAFPKYEIPLFMDHKRSILLNSFVEYIRSLLAMAEQNFSYESVFRYLRTGLSGLERDEVDILENYVIALGIRGFAKWQEKWIRKTRRMTEEDLTNVNRIRENFMGRLSEIMEVLKSRKKTVLDITRALHQFLLQEELQQRVQEYQIRFEAEGELALAKEYAQVYRIVIDVLDQFVGLLGEETLSLKEYGELLDAGLEEAKVGVIPPSIDQVVVGDVERSRIQNVKVVFLMGVSDNHLPGSMNNSGLLSEYDRQVMAEQGATLAPNMKEKTYIQKFYLYLAMTKPTEQVYLTYSKTSADGKSVRPSYLVTELARLFPGIKMQSVPVLLPDMELTKDSGIAILAAGLQKQPEGLTDEWKELYSRYKKDPEKMEQLERILDAVFYQKPDSILTRETAKRLYGDVLENSVTRLEQFSKCAYAHFLSYGLGLEEREEYQFRAMDLGNLFHSSLEKYGDKLEQKGFTWLDIPQTEQEQLIRESVEEAITDYSNSILYNSARNEYIIFRLMRMLRRSIWALTKHLEKGKFVPSGYEVSFGGFKELGASHMDLGNLGKLRLRGKIDRIDICEEDDKVFVKVIDYKTGKQTFDWNELCYGLQLQLFVYMNAAMEMQKQKHPQKEIVPAGLFYYQMKDPIVSKDVDLFAVKDAILKELRPNGIVQNSEEVVNRLDRDFEKASRVAPITKNKSGEIGQSAYTLSEKEFVLVSDYVNQKVRQIGTEILEGCAEIAPYELKGETGCQYCPYHAICGFEEQIPGYQYRKFEQLEKDEILKKMQEEVGVWESTTQQNKDKS